MNELLMSLSLIGFGGLLGVIIKHFLDRDREKIFFNKNLKKEIHFNLKNKAFELLMLIDRLEDKSIFLEKILGENALLEIKEYKKNKNNIMNLIRVYLNDFNLDTFITKDNIIENYLDLYSLILIEGDFNSKIFKDVDKLQKENKDFIDDLKKEISNYLIDSEKELFK